LLKRGKLDFRGNWEDLRIKIFLPLAPSKGGKSKELLDFFDCFGFIKFNNKIRTVFFRFRSRK
jgi:hypothetical protein